MYSKSSNLAAFLRLNIRILWLLGSIGVVACKSGKSNPEPQPMGSAPQISTPPSNQTVIAPDPASFTVEATGSAPLMYQWKRNGEDVPGATSATYSISTTSASDDGTEVTVVVTNSFGTLTSSAGKLFVNLRPAILAHPQSQAVTAPARATFMVSATGTGPLSYQWTKNGADIPGATGSTYTTAPTSASDNGARFAVVVNSPYGSATSNAAVLTVYTTVGPHITGFSPWFGRVGSHLII